MENSFARFLGARGRLPGVSRGPGQLRRAATTVEGKGKSEKLRRDPENQALLCAVKIEVSGLDRIAKYRARIYPMRIQSAPGAKYLRKQSLWELVAVWQLNNGTNRWRLRVIEGILCRC